MRNGIPLLWYCGPRGLSHVNRTKLTRLFRGVVIEEKDRSTNQTMVPSHRVLTVVPSEVLTSPDENLKFYTGVDM